MNITSAVRSVWPVAWVVIGVAFCGLTRPLVAQPWSGTDIGAVGAAGNGSNSGSSHTVNGSGADIWETSDEFHFRHTPWTGDGIFVARVTSITNTHTWAKAGIMLRESLTPGARHVMVCANPGNAAGFFARPAAGGATDFALGIYEIAQMWIRVIRAGNTFTAAQSSDGVNWAQIGAPVTLALPTTLYAGLAVTSHNDGLHCTGTFSNVAFTPVGSGDGTPTPPPAGTFASTDIGAVGAAGSTSVANAVYAVRGAGEDVFGPADEFHYHHRPWTGDGMFIVRVTNVQYTFNWAKAGIMIRSALTDNAQHAYAFISPELNHALVYRTATGGSTTGPTAVDSRQKAMPMWLRLTRAGSSVAMDYSFDGANWVRRASTTIAFPDTVYVGLAVNSHVDAQLCTATFDNFSLVRVQPTQARGVARSPTQVYLTWQDNDIDETGFEIERSSDNVTFTRVGTAPAWQLAGFSTTTVPPQAPPAFTDTSASPSSTYHYRVRSVTPRGPSLYSNPVTVTTPPPAPGGWNYLDIGDTALTGTSSLSGSTFTVTGAGSGVGSVRYYRESQHKGDYGANVTGYSDEFQFCWQPRTGDGEMVARLTGFSGAATGQAGIMVRVGTGANAFNVFCYVKRTGGIGVMARPRTLSGVGENYSYQTRSYYTSADPTAPPAWLKLVRRTEGVMCYASTDGTTWRELVWVTTPDWSADVLFGLAVSSEQDGSLTTAAATLSATFDNVTIGAITTASPPPDPPTNLRATQVSADRVSLTWEPPPATDQEFEIERSEDGVNFTLRARLWLNSWSDYNTGDTTYYYRARTVRYGLKSAYSSVLTVRTLAYPSAPTNLTATVLSATEVQLTWTDTSTTESNFAIYQSSDGTTFYHRSAVGANVTSYVVNWLSSGTTYYFKVGAQPWASGTANMSNIASATPGANPSPAAPGNLAATAVSPTRIDLAWTDNSTNETAFQLERSLNGTSFSLLATLPANTGQYSDTSVNGLTTYYYRVRATLDGGTPSAYSNVAQATTPSTPPTGDVWQSRDIGAVAAAGSASESGGVVTIRASGADIWNTADEFHFRFQPWTGDGIITARLTGLTDTNGWAKAGVMFRESLATDAQHAMMIVSVAHGSAVQYRTGTGTVSLSSAPSGNSTLPRWVRLERVGRTIAGYESFDGRTYYFVYSVTFASLAPTIYVGLAATSHNDGVLTMATFDNVSVAGPGAPAPVLAPSQFTAVAVSSTQIELGWTDNSSDETGFVIESSTDGSSYSHLVTVGPNVRAVSNAGLAPSTTYYYRLYAQRADARSTAVTASATTLATSTPPSGEWQSRDIGTTTAGSTSGAGSNVTLAGSGRDIWNTSDGFRYYYRQTSASDSDLIARVASLANTNGWAKAAVMFRESLDPGSAFVAMIVSAEHGIAFQYRVEPGAECASSAPTEDGSAPRWLRISRRGVTFYGYTSADGINWTQVQAISNSRFTSTGTWHVGLAVTSHNDGVLCTAAFDNVAFTESVPSTTPPSPATGLTATVASSSQINLAWSDASNNETGFEVERSTDGTNFTRISTTAANAVTYSDSGLTASTNYYYRVRAVNSAGASAYTTMVMATTQAGTSPPPPGTWQSNDVGPVAAAGSPSVSGTTVTLRGSGADIWNTADEFHFRSMPWTGDGEIITRVTTLTDTNDWAKAGVMFRENLTAGARHAFMCVSIAHGTALQYRTATGGESGSSPPSESGGVPRWLRLVRSGNTFTGYTSVDGTNWTQAGSITLALPATIQVGQVVTSHNDGVLCTATFESTTVGNGGSPPPPPPPPPPTTSWEFRDIGAVGVGGSNTSEGNTITVHASGADVWGTADGLRFVYRTLSGDGTVEAQVSSLENTHAWAKAGVMIRESLDANARNVFAFVTPSNGIVAQQRAVTGGTTAATAGPWWVQAPYWVRLVRAGGRITAFSSADGTNWTQFAAYDVTIGATAYVGFAVTSHDNTQLATAVFTDPFVQ